MGPAQLAHVDGLGCGGEQAVAVGHQVGAEHDQDCDGKSQLQHTWRGQEWELPPISHPGAGCILQGYRHLCSNIALCAAQGGQRQRHHADGKHVATPVRRFLIRSAMVVLCHVRYWQL